MGSLFTRRPGHQEPTFLPSLYKHLLDLRLLSYIMFWDLHPRVSQG